jgi:MraZ protein
VSVFLDTFTNKVDRKRRVSVPAPYRNGLEGQVVVLFPEHALSAVDCWSLARVQALSDNLDDPDRFSPEDAELMRLFFADGKQQAIDADGRIMLPDPLSELAGITDRATFVGLGEVFQIWDPARFEAYRKETLQRAAERRINPLRMPIRRPPEGGR